jgi:hypothetical protein
LLQNHPNHSWDVSRSFVMIEKQWFGFFVCWPPKLWAWIQPHFQLPHPPKLWAWIQPHFQLPHPFRNFSKTSLLHDLESVDLLQNHPKSFMGCIKIICDDWEAMVWLFCHLVSWILSRKQHELSHIFHSTKAKDQPASWHRVCWFAPKPSQIIHRMYQDLLWWLRSNGLAVLSVGLLNYDQTTASWILKKTRVPQHSSQKPVCFMT